MSDDKTARAVENEWREFEADATTYGFNIIRNSSADNIGGEPWNEYHDSATGHRWAGWLARALTVRRERDAALAMSRCECAADECCANLMRYREALEEIADLAGWHADDDACAEDTSPEDMVAHVNWLIRKICREALSGPDASATDSGVNDEQ